MKVIYPVCFYECIEKEGTYCADVPDLLGCVTQGDSLEDAIEMVQDAIATWILDDIENVENNEIPKASNIEDVELDIDENCRGGFKSLVMVDLSYFSEKWSKKAVKKTLTIPKWLNTKAEKMNINFSKILQEALIKEVVEK